MFIGEPGGLIEAGSLIGLQAGHLIEAGGVWHCCSNISRELLLEEIWYTRIPVRSSNISTERWTRTKALKLRKLCASFCMSAEKYRCNADKKGQKVSSIPRSILLYESIVDTDIDISKVSSIVSISIFDINNPDQNMQSTVTLLVPFLHFKKLQPLLSE